jgi:hypothetical protein
VACNLESKGEVPCSSSSSSSRTTADSSDCQ